MSFINQIQFKIRPQPRNASQAAYQIVECENDKEVLDFESEEPSRKINIVVSSCSDSEDENEEPGTPTFMVSST